MRLLLVFAFTLTSLAFAKEYKLTILHTNDHHGHFWKNQDGEYGMAARKTLIDQLRAEANAKEHCSVLLSGGDINTGVPESDLLDAKPDFLGMKALGYDAMAIGNHEFDNPIAILRKQMKWATFPFLASNVYSKKTGKRAFRSSVTLDHQKNCEGLKIAILGLTTDEVFSQNIQKAHLEIRSPVEEAKKIVPVLKQSHDLVIAVTHIGHYRDETSKEGIGDIAVAKAVEGIDIIVGGHSQEPLTMFDVENETLVLQAHEWGKYVGKLELSFDSKTKKVTPLSYRLIPVNLKQKVALNSERSVLVFVDKEIKEDKEMLQLLEPFQKKGFEMTKEEIGSTPDDFNGQREYVRISSAPIGQLICAAQMFKVNADACLMNGGGIRASIEAGVLTYRSVLSVQPFANSLSTVEMTETEMIKFLQPLADIFKSGELSGMYPHVRGMTFHLNEQGKIKSVYINGVRLTTKVKIALNSYMASELGLDTLPSFSDTGFNDALALKDFIKMKKVIKSEEFAPKESFVTIKN